MINKALFQEMNQLHTEFDRLFDDLGFGRMLDGMLPLVTDRFDVPAINLGEDKDHYYVEAQLPGFDMSQVELSVEQGHLRLAGQRERANADENIRWHRSERGYGSFERIVRLPGDVDAEGVSAEAKDGLLRVTLPKAETAKPKQIEIKIA